tara:strand:+ start:49 stop:789 length:741 start_codon:yes stop_codon:yes gene_type:complete
MISDLLKDLNVDCNFTNDIKESKYIEGSKNKNENNISMNTSNKQNYYPTFIKCIISEFDPIYGSLSEGEKKLYFSKKIMEICSEIDERDEYFKDYNFHKSLKSHNIQQGLQLYEKRINHISSLYYLNEYYKRHFVIVYENIAYPTCIKNYPKIYLSTNNYKVKILNNCNFPEMNIKNLFEKSKIVDDVKRDIKGVYNLYLEAIGKYKLDDLKKIAIECNIDLKDSKGKNKNKSILYDSINMFKLKL